VFTVICALWVATRACGPSVCSSWGSATLHPRLYAIARHRGLAYFVANDFLRKATWIASALKESFREHSKT